MQGLRSTSSLRVAALVAGAAAMVACSGGGPQPEQTLLASFLLGDDPLTAPVPMTAFTPSDPATVPEQLFSGTLRLVGVEHAGGFRAVHDPWDRSGEIGEPLRHLPAFEFEFVRRGSDVIPLVTGVQRSTHPYWEILLLPGKTWQVAGDDGWTRVALPFTLQERAANCTHNGVMSWLFRGDAVSRVAYQVVSETCGYFKADLWGVVDAEYIPADLADEAAPVIARVDAHRASRLPVQSLERLADDHPEIDATKLGVGDGIPAEDISVLGLVVDGIHYRSDCPTRQGPHPFCTSLPLPSYSTAKSIFASAATMRLEQLYPGVSGRSIASLVDECDQAKWRDVTIEDALDMATGNFESADFEVDEDSPAHEDFVFADRHADKIEFACNHFPRKAEPGTTFVYHTSDTYLVGVALQRFLDQRGGGDVYDSVLLEPIWRALNLSPQLDVSKRTYDDESQPFTGYGLTYEADDIVRIAKWLADGGTLDGEPALDTALLEESLQRLPGVSGLRAGSDDLYYNNGFWAYDAGPSLGCAEPVWVPFMSGVSGGSCTTTSRTATCSAGRLAGRRHTRFDRCARESREMLETRVGLGVRDDEESEMQSAAWRKRIRRPGIARRAAAPELPNWSRYPYPFIDGEFDASLFPLAEWREASRLALSVRDVREWSTGAGRTKTTRTRVTGPRRVRKNDAGCDRRH
jgi:CubicO group peptidase (beta-lactamase class C family)